MSNRKTNCPDCDRSETPVGRRDFLKTVSVGTAAAASGIVLSDTLQAAESSPPETVVKLLYDSLSSQQKEKVCFDWNHTESERGLLRTRVANNWNITEPIVNSDFYTDDQRSMIRDIFEGIIDPQWHQRVDKQLTDDAGGFGEDQSIAIFGQPGSDKFEFVTTGRHMTIRCDGNSADHVAFGGPIFYGHAAEDFYESANHPGNVYWPQALAANRVYDMLDGKQRKTALVETSPSENKVGFSGADGSRPGIPISELSSDQQEEAEKVLKKLLSLYRKSDREEAATCLRKQGGLEKCHLAFYKDNDIGNDKVWDNWRLEGPSFVWYFRGSPHVHVWVHVADDPSVKINA